MKLQYGFAFRKKECEIESKHLVVLPDEPLMFCRYEDIVNLKILTEEKNTHMITNEISMNNFRKLYKVVHNLHLLCLEDFEVFNLHFQKGIVYKFSGGKFSSLFSKYPWEIDDHPPSIGEIADNTLFFLSGAWFSNWIFKPIDKKEAHELKKEYEKSMNFKKFDL